MPGLRVDSNCELHYTVDDFTPPWSKSDVVVLLHGVAEAGEAWFGWMPELAAHYRVVRPDVRGFGRSTAMPTDFVWSMERLNGDLLALFDHLGESQVHLVAAKVGGTMAMHFAARHSNRLKSLTILGAPIAGGDIKKAGYSVEEIETMGVEHWARRTMSGRLGDSMPPEAHEWWAKMMGRTPASTQIGMFGFLPTVDVEPDLPNIKCPTLIITTGSATNVAQNITSADVVRKWQQTIPNSELLLLPSDSYHVAASEAAAASAATRRFIDRHAGPNV